MRETDMKEKILTDKKYGLRDYLYIPFSVYPFGCLLKLLTKLVSALLPALQVLTIAAFIDRVTLVVQGKAGGNEVYVPLLLLACILAFTYLNGQLIAFLNLKTELRLAGTYETALLDKRGKLEYWHIENDDSWNVVDRTCKETTEKLLRGFDSLLDMGELLIRVLSLLIILTLQVWWIGLAILAVSIPLFRVSLKAGKENYEAYRNAEKKTREAEYLHKVLTERESAEERTLFGYSDWLNKKWLEKYETARKITMSVMLRNYIKMKGSSLITVAISLIIILVLLYPLSQGKLTAGMFIALVSAALELIQLMSWQLARLTEQMAKNKAYMDDLTEFVGLSEDDGALKEKNASPDVVEEVEFRDVSFRYPGTDSYILKHFSLRIEKGRHYAFVGINGAGKTTIVKLLTGLYRGYEGDIFINGRNSREYDSRQLMDMFSVVYQDFARYQISFADNIRLGNRTETDEARFSQVLSFNEIGEIAQALPNGTDTCLGKIKKNGVDLSGGQWQKIAIGRALYQRASIRIMDEPTAALDPVSESNVYRIFGEASRDVTTIFITHRLGAARLADTIVVLDGGNAAETGSHEELMAKQGIYAEMFEAQRSWYQ